MRELYGVVMAEGANRGILITSGTYTGEAQAFARGKPLDLIASPELARMIDAVRKTPTLCPRCGGEMVLRTARRGANAGEQFWGCIRFPQCRGITGHQALRRCFLELYSLTGGAGLNGETRRPGSLSHTFGRSCQRVV